MRHGWLLRNPFAAGPPLIVKSNETRRDRIPSPEEERRILAACDDPKRRHLRVYILATRDTGLRMSALRSLTWDCVDWQREILQVPTGNRLKRRPRLLGLTARLRDALREWHQGSAPGPKTPLLPPVASVKRAWNTACRLAEVEGLRLNDLRHGYATDLMEAGLPQHFAMKLAGHTTAEVHDIYTNVDERLAREAADALTRLHQSRQ
jgi:integrase